MKFINENIKKFRIEKGWTREDLVDNFKKFYNIDVAARTIQNWESGDTTPDGHMIARLAQIFDRPVYLFFTLITYQQGKVSYGLPPKRAKSPL